MISAVLAVILTSVVFVCLCKNAYKRPDNFPPGPPSVPFLGAYPIVRWLDFHNVAGAFLKLGEMYRTKVLGLYLGDFTTVVLNDPASIKEMLLNEDFDGRIDGIVARLRSYWKRFGIFFTEGYFWHTQRRFSLRYLRDYGFGRRDDTLEETVASEIREMIDMTTNGPKYPAEKELVKGDLIQLPNYFVAPFVNGMCHVLSRSTLPRSDYHVLWDISRHIQLFQEAFDIGSLLPLRPSLKHIAPGWSGYNNLCKGNQFLLDFVEKMVADVMATHDESYDRHFLDVYVRKMKEESRTEKKTTYSVEQLCLLCVDYIFPASSAPGTVLTMLVERLLLQPEIQHRIHEEIDRVVGRDRPPTLDDRRNMPYTEACLREAMRYDPPLSLGVPHRALKDTKLGGYDIPESTMVAANYISLSMDKAIWGDPEVFRPERFIIDGRLSVASDKSLPFGAGHRLCVGETYVRQTMFQVFAAFMQAFQLSAVEPLKGPAPRKYCVTTTIPEFWVRVTPRK